MSDKTGCWSLRQWFLYFLGGCAMTTIASKPGMHWQCDSLATLAVFVFSFQLGHVLYQAVATNVCACMWCVCMYAVCAQHTEYNLSHNYTCHYY